MSIEFKVVDSEENTSSTRHIVSTTPEGKAAAQKGVQEFLETTVAAGESDPSKIAFGLVAVATTTDAVRDGNIVHQLRAGMIGPPLELIALLTQLGGSLCGSNKVLQVELVLSLIQEFNRLAKEDPKDFELAGQASQIADLLSVIADLPPTKGNES